MMSKNETSGEGSGNGRRLLNDDDIDEFTKALYLKDMKSNWRRNTFKSFKHVHNNKRSFKCCFSVQVHSIQDLPSTFNDLTLCVKWKTRDGELTTRLAPVSQGVAPFEELLTNTRSVHVVQYGSTSGPHHSSAKYEAKHFVLYASVYEDPDLDLGKHRFDLTRLLPLTLKELEDNEKSSGKWSATYKLSGKAKGATMNVSFGYSVAHNSKSSGQTHPVISHSSYNRSVEDIKDVQIVPLEHQNQVFDSANPDKGEFSVLEPGMQFSVKEKIIPEQDMGACEELTMQELELVLNNVIEVSDSQEESENLKEQEEEGLKGTQSVAGFGYEASENMEVKIGHKEEGEPRRLCATVSVADDFLNMLGIEHSHASLTSESESNSPRERLLRQFKKDALSNNGSISNCNLDDDDDEETRFISDSPSTSMWDPIPKETNKTQASIMEEMETEALMHEWGFNQKVFESSPSSTSHVYFSRPIQESGIIWRKFYPQEDDDDKDDEK